MITQDLLKQFDSQFKGDKSNQASRHAISEVGFKQASLNQEVKREHSFTFSDQVKNREGHQPEPVRPLLDVCRPEYGQEQYDGPS